MKTIVVAFLLCLLFGILHGQDSLRLHLNFDDNLDDLSKFKHNVHPLSELNFVEGICSGSVIIKDNTTDGIVVDHHVFNQLQDFTISAWVKLNGLNSNNNLISCANAFLYNSFIVGYNSVTDRFQDGWHFVIGGEYYYFDPDLTMNDFEWHHVIMMRRGNQGFLFIDWQLAGEPITVDDKRLSAGESGAIIGQDQDCLGGCFEPNQSWNGEIDDLKVFSKALTPEEITDLDCSEVFDDDQTKASSIILYPVPFTDHINLMLENEAIDRFELFTALGQIVQGGKVLQNRIDFHQNIVPGVYFLKLYRLESESYRFYKVIKQ